jgi:hypothetical protein
MTTTATPRKEKSANAPPAASPKPEQAAGERTTAADVAGDSQTNYRRRLETAERNFRALRTLKVATLLDIDDVDDAGIDHVDLANLKMFGLILNRNLEANTPVEKFLVDLVSMYASYEDSGAGLTVEAVEQELQTLRESLPEAIEHARFFASRYESARPRGTGVEPVPPLAKNG